MRKYTDLLKGVRVVELCWAWAGPLAGRMFGDLGAEVIKIEGPSRPDAVRFGNYPDNDPGTEPWNRGGHFQKHSRNKKSLVLDLTAVRGREIFLDLIERSDVFIENNAPRVLVNLGITYDDIRKRNPRIVMVSMPGFGNSGPMRDWVAFGLNLEAYCGISSITGYADTGPVRSVVPYGDPIVGMHATIAALAALRAARRTGRGRFVEVAQDESLLNILLEPIFRATVGDEDPSPDGCHHEHISPHSVYATKGDDEWVCLTAAREDEFAALAKLVGHEEWLADAALDSPFKRKAREVELDQAISAWTTSQPRDDAVAALRRAGVPAAPAQRVDEVVNDPLLARRGYWQDVVHPVTGRLPYAHLPWSYWQSERAELGPAPLFGQHNREVLEGILGMSSEAVDQLEADGIIATRPNMA